ncbi:MAG: hypothetical protein NC084_08055 [Bacteroides sp.]|nr:hypothetical protein [Eubacterium sp.]MCM1418594.1 hypothetical protein [Roseburia sp.]MCM1462648.1 hypothetical protein [Bacteroides sp.]
MRANEKRKRKFLCLLAAIFALSACGETSPTEGTNTAETETTVPTETVVAETAETDAKTETVEAIELSFPDPDLEPFDEYDCEQIDFEEAVARSYCVVRAECIGAVRQTPDKRVYAFRRVEVLNGGEMPETFSVTILEGDYSVEDSVGYVSTDIWYEAGTEYILPLRKSISVFYDEDAYYPSGDAFIALDEGGAVAATFIQGRTIDEIADEVADDVRAYLDENALSCAEPEEEIGTPFIRSDDLDEIIAFSDYVLGVETTGYFQNFAEDRTTYECSVTEILKAENDNISNVYAALPKDSAEIGEKYLLLLKRSGPTSYVYVISSPSGSVYAADSDEAAAIRERLK